jgi:hypothetical protein
MMKKQILTTVLGAVVVLGTVTTLFAQNGLPTGGYPPVMGGAAGNPGFVPAPVQSAATSAVVGQHAAKHQRKIYMSAKHQKNGH